MSDKDCISLEMLYGRYHANMLYRALKYVNNMEDAEDIVSESWLSLLEHLPKLMNMEDKARSTYIMRCVQNTAIDHLRRCKRDIEAAERNLADVPLQERPQVPERSLQSVLSRLLVSVPRRERQVVELRICGYDDRTIAGELGITESTVRVYLHRAHRQMRAEMQNIKSEKGKVWKIKS